MGERIGNVKRSKLWAELEGMKIYEEECRENCVEANC